MVQALTGHRFRKIDYFLNRRFVLIKSGTIPFGFEFFKGLKTPPGTPNVYDTPAGRLGGLAISVVGKFLPF